MKVFQVLLLAGLGLAVSAGDLSRQTGGPEPVAPPLPVQGVESSGSVRTLRGVSSAYSIGDPSAEEQLYLELINRARAGPVTEGSILANITDPQVTADYLGFGIDLNLMRSQFAAIAPAQPLAFSSALALAAKGHSEDMFTNVFQDHVGTDGSTLKDRITNVGFFGSAAENVYANAKSVLHGHAAFEVDWGGAAQNGGMQSPPGHRENSHNPVFREVGIGVVLGVNSVPGKTPLSQVGPEVVTEDFGVAQYSTPLITGVAYYDLNRNAFYDVGEGIGNIHVTVDGQNYEAFTARSGGYAIPVTGNGTYTVTFAGNGFDPFTKTVQVVGSKNVKLDFSPAYVAPVITGPSVPALERDNAYLVSSVAGATEYQWRSFQRQSAASEGAENDSTRLSIAQTGTYDAIEGIVVKHGLFAFHLVTPAAGAVSQYITLSPNYMVGSASSLNFQSELGYATTDQHAQVQVSPDAGATWQTVYDQSGNPDAPETDWSGRTVNLSSYTGKSLRIRFAFEFIRGNYFDSTSLDPVVGWLIDDIQFNGLQEITNEQIGTVVNNAFNFHPAVLGDFSLQVRARTGHNFLDWGPALPIRSGTPSGAPQLHIRLSMVTGGQLQFMVDLAGGAAPTGVTLEAGDTLNGSWNEQPATVQTISSTQYQVLLGAPTTSRFYRIRAN